MSLTPEFRQAVAQKNCLRVKIMLKDSLLVDPSFRQFNEMIQYVESSRLGIWVDDGDDDIVLPDDPLMWNDDYLNSTLVGLVGMFSRKRVNYLKKIINRRYSVQPNKVVQKSVAGKTYVIYDRVHDRETFDAYEKIVEKREQIAKVCKEADSKNELKSTDVELIRKYSREIMRLCNSILER